MSDRILIDDQDEAQDVLATVHDLGYCPFLVPKGKDWLTSYKGRSLEWGGDNPPSLDDLSRILRHNPQFGLSISIRHFQTRDYYPYVIDLDVYDEDAMADIRKLLPPGAVAWAGDKAGALMFRRRTLSETGLIAKVHALDAKSPSPMMGKQTNSITVPRYRDHPLHQGNKKKAQVEFLSEKLSQHALIPPTLHVKASERRGEDWRYHWIEGQPTLLNTPTSQLPWLEDYHLMIVYEWCRNPDSATVNFFRSVQPGETHDLVIKAAQHMSFEGWEPEDVERAILDRLARLPDHDERGKEREKEARDAIRGSIREVKKKGGPDPSRPKGSQSAPMERQIEAYLSEVLPHDDVRNHNKTVYHWQDNGWSPLYSYSNERGFADPVLCRITEGFPASKLKDMQAGFRLWEIRLSQFKGAPHPDKMGFRNGVLDVNTMELSEEVKEDYLFQKVEFDYDPEATCPRWDDYVRHICRPPREYEGEPTFESDWDRACDLLEEYLGYTLFPSYQFRKMLYLIGASSTGKSRLAKVIKGIMPPGWVSEVGMNEMENANARKGMVGAFVNFGAEVDRGRHPPNVDGFLLNVTSAEPVEVWLYHVGRFQMVLPTRLVFHGNSMPVISDTTDAMMNRLMLIKTTDIVPAEIKEFEKTLLAEKEGIVRKLVGAYKRLLERGDFVLPSYNAQARKEQFESANPITAWMTSGMVEPVEEWTHGTPVEVLYQSFRAWADEFAPGYKSTVISFGMSLAKAGKPGKVIWINPPGKAVRMRQLRLAKNAADYLNPSRKF